MSSTNNLYRPDIDGLRALSILPVVGFHAQLPGFQAGFVGVDVFFVISGYLITLLLVRESEQGGIRLSQFWYRRARRLLPTLLLVILSTLILFSFTAAPQAYVSIAKSAIAAVLFVANFFFFSTTNYFSNAHDFEPLLHFWSLAVEEQFYLFFPLLFIVLGKVGGRIGFLLALALFSLLFAQLGGNLRSVFPYVESVFLWSDQPKLASYLLPFGRIWELLLGCTLALYVGSKATPIRPIYADFGSAFGLILLLVSMWVVEPDTPYSSVATLLPVSGALMCLYFAPSSRVVASALRLPVLVNLGLISYGLYLWHLPLLVMARALVGESASPLAFWLATAVAVTLSFLVSALTWRRIEKPFRDPSRVSTTTFWSFCLVLVILVGGLCWFILRSGGFVERYSEEDRDLASFDISAEAQFVPQAFQARTYTDFEPGKPKLLLIGDSYAMDFLNAGLAEGYLAPFSIVAHHVERQCGLVVSAREASEYVQESDRAYCDRRERLDSDRVRALVAQAELVVLAARWESWVVEAIPETISHIRNLGASNIMVVGGKHFGYYTHEALLAMSKTERLRLRTQLDETELAVIRKLSVLDIDVFYIDVQSVFCDSSEGCDLFQGQSLPVSFDGKHLTLAGAELLGARLSAQVSPILQNVITHLSTGE